MILYKKRGGHPAPSFLSLYMLTCPDLLQRPGEFQHPAHAVIGCDDIRHLLCVCDGRCRTGCCGSPRGSGGMQAKASAPKSDGPKSASAACGQGGAVMADDSVEDVQ